ncbi:MAG: 16S rRNA (cytidine(1402)-2'-O)-methyltransferase [Alphaproteobacteria bacterium]|nr:16S rRNA (cytidine(1402)-2'-O)-methyltransferase [Alphaproteobacteria bacterium]
MDSNTASKSLAAGLYIVATPIGNARDITLRALDVLSGANVIAAEDTRVTRRLLDIHGIKAPEIIRYDEHVAERARPILLARVAAGEAVALATDAGTPLVSDPGYRLAAAAIAEGLKVIPIPGASAPLAALALAGLPSDRFLFAGFAPNKSGQRRKWLAEIAETQATLILFENAKRLASSLNDMAAVLGDRQACVTRELTKLFEEARRGTLSELAGHYAESGPPKGEVTLVIGPPEPVELDETALDDLLADLLNTLSVKDAATQAAERTGAPRKQAYQRALAIKQDKV